MKLTIFNGSPKLAANNTQIMVDSFIEGFKSIAGNEVRVHKLNKLTDMEAGAKIFEESEMVMIAFPLYTYAMPGGVKSFIEALEPLCGKCKKKKLLFLVQYGFREAIHARPLEKYNEQLADMLDCEYVGTIIKGGCDGLTAKKTYGAAGILKGIQKIGTAFGQDGQLDQQMLKAYAAPETEKKQAVVIMKVIMKMINKYYWGAMLKKNGVSLDESYARPYLD